jgi:hypothetical protein
MRDISWLEGQKRCGGANFFAGGEGREAGEGGGFGDGDGAACNQCHDESRLSSMGKSKSYCGCGTAVHKVTSSEVPTYGLRVRSSTWQSRLSRSVSASGCLFGELSSRAKAPNPAPAQLSSALLQCCLCSRSLSCDTAGSSAANGSLHACSIDIPHPHISALHHSFLPPSTPRALLQGSAKPFTIRIFWARPGQHPDTGTSAMFDLQY